MFTTISKAGTGASVVVILNALFPLLGVQVPEGSVEQTLQSGLNIFGFTLLVWGQVARKDLTLGLFRKY